MGSYFLQMSRFFKQLILFDFIFSILNCKIFLSLKLNTNVSLFIIGKIKQIVQNITMQPNLLITTAVLFSLVCSFLLFSASAPQNKLYKYQQWKTNYGLKYQKFEDIYRMKLFFDTDSQIEKHNSRKEATYKMGFNKFSAMTDEQFRQKFLQPSVIIPQSQIQSIRDDITGASIDWVQAGAVTPVKDQGQCKSTYAFATIGGIQALSAFTFGKAQQYSAQQIIDCSKPFDNQGCNGGNNKNSYQYATTIGIVTQLQYPFIGKDQACKKTGSGFKIRDYSGQIYSCIFLAQALMNIPVSVSVDATNFKTYKSGIFSNCGKTEGNAFALVVGMTDNFWKLKMSWSQSWGQNGYIRLERGNTCGVCNQAFYPVK